MRIGEATNPGPPEGPQLAETGLQLQYASPEQEGFWGAVLPGHDEHGERGRRREDDEKGQHYQLCVDTCNGTSWGSLKRYIKRTRSDVLLCQEHHLPPNAIASASQWAYRRGWQTVWAPAEPGEGSGWKGGVCICARKPVALSVPRHGGTIVQEARAVAAVAEAPGYRPMTLYAAYLRHWDATPPDRGPRRPSSSERTSRWTRTPWRSLGLRTEWELSLPRLDVNAELAEPLTAGPKSTTLWSKRALLKGFGQSRPWKQHASERMYQLGWHFTIGSQAPEP